jgi:deazaflavin-dependent oxidoreductase (nitroreductase family)
MRAGSLLNRLIDLHVALYRASRGRIGHRVRGAPPILLLDHVGTRSGRHRTAPLGYIRDGDDIVVVASKGGYPHNPAWYHNLMANPHTTVQIGSRRLGVRARAADPAERERLWPKVLEAHQGYESYQQRTQRTIPLVILEPRRDVRPGPLQRK